MGPGLVSLAVLAEMAIAPDDTVIVRQRGPQLELRLRCRGGATATDRHWLQVEFNNMANAPLLLQG